MANSFATILVSNGTAVLDSPRGELIDSYQNVVRFNRFHLLPQYCKFTGTKTDVWAIGMPIVRQKDGKADPDNFLTIARRASTWLFVASYRPEGKSDWHQYREAAQAAGCIVVDEKLSARIKAFFGKWQPSSGAITLGFYGERGGCALLGFSHFTREKLHFGDNIEKQMQIHNSELEKRWFDLHVKEGKAIRL